MTENTRMSGGMRAEDSGLRWGPFRLNFSISVTGVLTAIMAFTGVIGGWYTFDYRVQTTEKAIMFLNVENEKRAADERRLNDTLNQANGLMGRIIQALDDRNIHVHTNLSFSDSSAAADAPPTHAPALPSQERESRP